MDSQDVSQGSIFGPKKAAGTPNAHTAHILVEVLVVLKARVRDQTFRSVVGDYELLVLGVQVGPQDIFDHHSEFGSVVNDLCELGILELEGFQKDRDHADYF